MNQNQPFSLNLFRSGKIISYSGTRLITAASASSGYLRTRSGNRISSCSTSKSSSLTRFFQKQGNPKKSPQISKVYKIDCLWFVMCLLLAPAFQGFFFFFLQWPLTVLMKQARQAVCAFKQSILLRCLWKSLMASFFVTTSM